MNDQLLKAVENYLSNPNPETRASLASVAAEEREEREDSRRAEIVALAQSRLNEEGKLEIEGNALVSEGNDNGCYVSAWVWLDFAGTDFDKAEVA